MSKPRWGKVVKVNAAGVFQMAHPNGDITMKRLTKDSSSGDFRTLVKNTMKEAKVVETPEGGTVTFPGGETIRFKEIKAGE